MEHILELILVTLIPGVEIRGSIPLGIAIWGLDPVSVIIICTLVNLLVIVPGFYALEFFWKHVSHINSLGKYEDRIRRKARPYVKKYGFWGILLFVAIPLPGTGVYTGTFAAWLLGMQKKRAFIAISLGVLIASALISAMSLGFLNVLNWLL